MGYIILNFLILKNNKKKMKNIKSSYMIYYCTNIQMTIKIIKSTPLVLAFYFSNITQRKLSREIYLRMKLDLIWKKNISSKIELREEVAQLSWRRDNNIDPCGVSTKAEFRANERKKCHQKWGESNLKKKERSLLAPQEAKQITYWTNQAP